MLGAIPVALLITGANLFVGLYTYYRN